MIKRIFTLLVSFACTFHAFSQEAFDLEQCINYALENNKDIQNKKLDQSIAKMKVKETISEGLPQINGKFDVIWNREIQTQFIPAEGGFIPGPPNQDVIGFAFGVDYSGNMNATLSQLIFNGSYFIGLKASKTYKELSSKSVDASTIEVVEKVTKAYYQVLLIDEQLELIRINLGTLDSLYNDTKVLYDNGFAEEMDLHRITVSRNNLKTQHDNLRRLKKVNYNLLKFQINYPINEEIVINDSLVAKKISEADTNSNNSFTYSNRIEQRMLNVNKELQSLNLKNEKSRFLPSLSAFGQVGYNKGTLELGELANTQGWENYSLIGLTLDVPIFSSGRRYFRIQQASLEYEKLLNQENMLQQSIDLEIANSLYALKLALKALEREKENSQLAKSVYDKTKLKYEEGVVRNFEVTETFASYRESQVNYYKALYDALIAEIDYKKATGTLYNN